MTIKAIETNYAGCRFRSRLEARWAVVFDHLGIPWQYELEGFELSDGQRYLPDFYLPEHGAWLEVKHRLDHNEPKWRRFFEDLAEETGFRALSMGRRKPWEGPIPDRTFMVSSVPDGGLMEEEATPTPVPVIAFSGWMLGPGSPHAGWAIGLCQTCSRIAIGHVAFESPLGCHDTTVIIDDPQIIDALAAGRTARFEHGETPPR